MKKIIINADDFGLTDGCNKGIIKAIEEGIVTSTTVMMNMPHAIKGIESLKSINFSSIGVHLTLTCGKPTLPIKEVSTLVNEKNEFYKRKDRLFPNMDLKEVEKELRNQIELFIKTGLQPTHLDSHHHIHIYKGIREVVCKLAKEYNLPLRGVNSEITKFLNQENILTTDDFSMKFYGEGATVDTLKEILTDFNGRTMEIMAHPGMIDENLMLLSSYNNERFDELKILTNKDIKTWIEKKGYKMVSYENI